VADFPFFPSPSLQLEQVVLEPQTVVFVLRTVAAAALCPDCGQLSDRVHSRYRRRLTDLPAQGRAIRVELLARRFFCTAADCPRHIFTERLPEIVAVRGRTTARLHDAHCDIGFALGGEAGARLAARLAMPTSPDTLLRRVRNAPLPNRPFVRVLGVDDWAFRKGHRYGTILCDLERHSPVDLLPERSAEALCDWLKGHPEVEIISRDRGDDYIRGATAGAPQAVQVADRWHLLRNLRDALKGAVDRHYAEVQAAARAVASGPQGPPHAQAGAVADDPPTPATPPPPLSARVERQQIRRQRREELYEQVLVLHRKGLSGRAIAERLGLHRSTVKRFMEAGTFPGRAERHYARRTDRFADYLKRRWAEGCRNAAELFEELKAQGFGGSYYSVRRQLAAWRKADPGAGGCRGTAAVTSPGMERPSARRVSWLILKNESELEPEEQAFLDRLHGRCPELRTAGELARRFADMVRARQEGAWDGWVAQATAADAAKELRSFAEGLQKDEAAVRAALRLAWSNGQVEGQVNRLKLIKRQMFGRAKFDLLRKRVLKAG
jgi:transposase